MLLIDVLALDGSKVLLSPALVALPRTLRHPHGFIWCRACVKHPRKLVFVSDWTVVYGV